MVLKHAFSDVINFVLQHESLVCFAGVNIICGIG